MADVLMIVVVAGFFALAVGYVRLCDRVIGPDPLDGLDGLDDREQSKKESEVRHDLRLGR